MINFRNSIIIMAEAEISCFDVCASLNCQRRSDLLSIQGWPDRGRVMMYLPQSRSGCQQGIGSRGICQKLRFSFQLIKGGVPGG